MIPRSVLGACLALAACTPSEDDTSDTSEETRSYAWKGTWDRVDFQKATLEITDRPDGGQTVTGTSVLDYTGFWALRLVVSETVEPDGVVQTWVEDQRNLLGTSELAYHFEIDPTDHTALQGLADRAATIAWEGDDPVVTYAYPSEGFFQVAHPTPVAGYVTGRALALGRDLNVVLPYYGIAQDYAADDGPLPECITWFGDGWCFDDEGVPTTFVPASYGAPVERVEDPAEIDLGWIVVAAPTTVVAARDCSIPGDGPRHLVYTTSSADGTAISGRLLLPEGTGPFPTVTANAGTGGMDREGTVWPSAQWNCIAHDLLAQGIAVASYDDRGIGASGGRPSDSFDGRTEDVVAVATWVKARPEVGGLYLLGHSEGVAHVTAAAPQVDAAGLVLVAGLAGTGAEGWVEQARVYLEGLGFPEAQVTAFIEGRESIAAQLVAGNYDDHDYGGLPVDDFWAPFLTFDGTALALATDEPVLVVQGGKDWQVPPHNGQDLHDALSYAGRDVTLAAFPDLGHLLQPAIGPAPCGLEYHLPWSWDASVSAAIGDWIEAREAPSTR